MREQKEQEVELHLPKGTRIAHKGYPFLTGFIDGFDSSSETPYRIIWDESWLAASWLVFEDLLFLHESDFVVLEAKRQPLLRNVWCDACEGKGFVGGFGLCKRCNGAGKITVI